MRKEDIASLVIYGIMIGVAIIVGLTAVQSAFTSHYHLSSVMPGPLFAIIAIVVGLIINVVMLEVGHIIGAKCGGYAVISVNILWFCFYKKDGKTQFAFKDYDGLTGETKIAPKSDKAKLGYYIWIPVAMYVIELVSCIVLITLAEDKGIDNNSPLHWLSIAALLFIILSSMLALYNLVPIRLDSMTDGYRLMLSSKEENLEAYNELLRIEALRQEGKEVGEIKIFPKITEFTANINLISVYERLGNHEFEKAEELIDMIIADPSKVFQGTYHRLLAQKLFIKITTLSLEESKQYYEKNVSDELLRFIANDLSMESLRTYILIAGLLDKSNGEVEFAKARKDRALKRCLPSRRDVESQLYDEALNKVYEAHPDWVKQA